MRLGGRAHPRRGRWTAALGALAVLAVGCEPWEVPPDEVTVATWWTQGEEKAALDALVALYASHGGSIRVEAQTGSTGANADWEFTRQTSKAPSAIQANCGYPLASKLWADGCDARTELIAGIPSEILLTGDRVRGDIERTVQYLGEYYAVPLGIHRLNVLHYDSATARGPVVERLHRIGTIEDLMGLAKEECSVPLFAITGDDYAYPSFLFQNVLPLISPAYYRRFWDGCADVDPETAGPELRALAAAAVALWPCVQSWSPEAQWAQSLEEALGAGQLVSIGDWAAKPARDRRPDAHTIPFPGTADVLVYTSDTLALTKGHTSLEATARFLDVAFSEPGQIAFNCAKRSVPARQIDFEAFREGCPDLAQDPEWESRALEIDSFFATDPSSSTARAVAAGDPVLLATSGLVQSGDMDWLGASIDSVLRTQINDALGSYLRQEQKNGLVEAGADRVAAQEAAILQLLAVFYPRVVQWAWRTGRLQDADSPCAATNVAQRVIQAQGLCPNGGR